jgi:agmatine deiminase
MTWTMPPETFRQDRIWMAFPREGETLGADSAAREAGYAAWTAAAHAIAEFEPVTMIVDPSEVARARRMLGSGIEVIVRVIDDFWMRDTGPTFVHDASGNLAAVDWIFNGWGVGPGPAPRMTAGLVPLSPGWRGFRWCPRFWSTRAAGCMWTARARSC